MFFLFFIMKSFSLYSQKNKSQPQNQISNNFDYQDCTCAVKIDLKIFNGLDGIYGGSAVNDSREVTKGAVTVANLNDTDGDNITDNIDNSVTATPQGRDEVDLMKLEIISKGKTLPSCPDIELVYQGSIALWKNKTKDIPQSTIIPISSLPLTIWVEATQVSSSLRDIQIQALVDGEIKDEVKATAIWVDITPQNIFYQPSALPAPNTLGLDAPGLLNTINNNHLVTPLGMLSKNLDRYGFGTFAEGNMPSSPNTDLYFGGKILFRWKLLPDDAYSLGNIKLDIARRKNTTDTYYSMTQHTPTISTTNPPLPQQNEGVNDDPQASYGNDNLDEDKTPDSQGYFFSYDTPATPNGYFYTLPSSNLAPIVIRDLNFEEFVRVSFDTPPIGNIVAGSRCSIKQPWSLNCANYCSTSNDLTQPYNERSQSYSQANGGIKIITRPRSVSQPQPNDGNGIITINSLNSTYNTFLLQYNLPTNPNQWKLSKLNPNGTWSFSAWSLSINPNTWEINSTDVNIIINQGSINFSPIAEFVFKVLTIPSTVTNQLNNY